MRRVLRAGAAAIAFAACLVAVPAAPAAAQDHGSAPDAGIAFEPPPLPEPAYDIRPPSADAQQVRIVTAADGTPIYTETWLPVARADGPVPPARLPVVLVYTPYAARGVPDFQEAIDVLVPRGYAVTFAHVRGSGGSGGCIAQLDQHEVDDGARVVEDAGTLAPWSSGALGMAGVSYPGGTQLATATGPDRARLRSLKALIVGAPAASGYEFYNHDGVPHLLQGIGSSAAYLGLLSNPQDSPERLFERLGCQLDVLLGVSDVSGDYNAWFEERDHTRRLDRLEAATLMLHGSADSRVPSMMQAGLFDNIPASTPHVGLFGVWDHELPDRYGFNGPLGPESPRRNWERADWDALAFAWFERHVRGVDNGVDAWPAVQVQGTDGQWRTASNWPAIPGERRALALGAGGVLGAAQPVGASTYLEGPSPELDADGLPTDLPGTTAVFTTPPLEERLELVGMPELELWVQLLLPDSHITARLEAVHPAGERITHESRTVGARAATHIQPLDRGRFRQRGGVLAPILQPFLVTIRFNPIDLVVPAGGRLRLTVAGGSILYDGLDGIQQGLGAVFQGPSLWSGMVQPVTILHDPAHPSALRYSLPEDGSTLLDVREKDQVGQQLGLLAGSPLAVDGGLGAAPDAPAGAPLPATGGAAPLALPAVALLAALALHHRATRRWDRTSRRALR